jgi:hypothetical protein
MTWRERAQILSARIGFLLYGMAEEPTCALPRLFDLAVVLEQAQVRPSLCADCARPESACRTGRPACANRSARTRPPCVRTRRGGERAVEVLDLRRVAVEEERNEAACRSRPWRRGTHGGALGADVSRSWRRSAHHIAARFPTVVGCAG